MGDNKMNYGDIKEELGGDRVSYGNAMPSDLNSHGGDASGAWVVFGLCIGVVFAIKEFKNAI